MFGFHTYFDIRHNLDGRVVSITFRPHFTHIGKELNGPQDYRMQTDGKLYL